MIGDGCSDPLFRPQTLRCLQVFTFPVDNFVTVEHQTTYSLVVESRWTRRVEIPVLERNLYFHDVETRDRREWERSNLGKTLSNVNK